MTTFSPISLACSVCNTIFESNEIGSCGFGSKRTDFRPNYWGFNPVIFFYHLCPNCGFCGPKSMFESKLDNAELRKKIDQLGPLSEFSLSQKLERAVICLQIMNDLEMIYSSSSGNAPIFHPSSKGLLDHLSHRHGSFLLTCIQAGQGSP